MVYINVYKINAKLIKIASKKYAFFFPDSESLTKAILLLLKKTNCNLVKSAIYFFKGSYVLITENLPSSKARLISEFYILKTENSIKIEAVKEYGKCIIISNAISAYGVAFSKKSK